MGKTKIEWVDRVDINGYTYRVSKTGLIQGSSGKILKGMKTKSGHLYVFIGGKRKYIHRLVLEAFVGYCPTGKECRHLDGNPENNNLENLTWGSRQENSDDKRKHGRMPIPHKSIFTKLKPVDIPRIKELHDSGLSSRKIGSYFGTSHTTIQKIIRGERWKGYV